MTLEEELARFWYPAYRLDPEGHSELLFIVYMWEGALVENDIRTAGFDEIVKRRLAEALTSRSELIRHRAEFLATATKAAT